MTTVIWSPSVYTWRVAPQNRAVEMLRESLSLQGHLPLSVPLRDGSSRCSGRWSRRMSPTPNRHWGLTWISGSCSPGRGSSPRAFPAPLRGQMSSAGKDLADGGRELTGAPDPHHGDRPSEERQSPAESARGTGRFFHPQHGSVVSWGVEVKRSPEEEKKQMGLKKAPGSGRSPTPGRSVGAQEKDSW